MSKTNEGVDALETLLHGTPVIHSVATLKQNMLVGKGLACPVAVAVTITSLACAIII
jgi:hypothetical protein